MIGTPGLLSLVVEHTNEPIQALRATARSLREQTDPRWELIVHVSGATALDVSADPVFQDPRVRFLRHDGTSSAPEGAFSQASGAYVAVIDSGGQLEPAAVESIAEALEAATGCVDVFCTDEIVLGADGVGNETLYKPPWSPERLRGQHYPGRLCGFRSGAIQQVGGVRPGFGGAAEHDLMLRVGELAGAVIRVPGALYRGPTPAPVSDESWDAHTRAVQQHLERVGIAGVVERSWHPGTTRVVRDLDRDTSVCLVIPTRGDQGLVWGEKRAYVVEAARSVLARSGLRQLQVVVVHTMETPDRVLTGLRDLGEAVHLEPWTGPMDFAGMVNRGAILGRGDVIVLLDERSEVESDDFLGQLVAPLVTPGGAGLTGPRVLASNGLHTGAGVALHELRADPMFVGRPDEDSIRTGVLAVSRETSALLPTCLALTRETFDEVGGVNERLRTRFHVDLAQKVGHLGLSAVWVAHARLRSFPPIEPEPLAEGENALLGQRWPLREVDVFMPHFGQWRARRKAEEASLKRARRTGSKHASHNAEGGAEDEQSGEA